MIGAPHEFHIVKGIYNLCIVRGSLSDLGNFDVLINARHDFHDVHN